jgi:XTP/dITP diphosphohydrolase
MILYACSTNPGKLNEFSLAASDCSVPGPRILLLPDLKRVTPPDETGATFEENAAIKAVYYSGFTEELVFADDSGLEVDALGGEPGVFSARYAGPEATDAANNELLLRKLERESNRHGRFVCAIALAKSGNLLKVVHVAVEGEILEGERGKNGFGYDPVFFYPPLGRGFGELSAEDKFAVSHRGNALRALFAHIGGT